MYLLTSENDIYEGDDMRVILWGPGQMGIGALRALIQHPGLELAGLVVHSEAKEGRDAGDLCGLPSTGIIATRDIDAALAVDADVVAYYASGDYRYREAADDIARCLRAGKNVVTTSLVLVLLAARGGARPARDARSARAATAVRRCSTAGSNPGGSTTVPFVFSSTCARIDTITMQEILDYAPIAQPDIMYDFMGFAHPPDDGRRRSRSRAGSTACGRPWCGASPPGSGSTLDSGRRFDGEVGDPRDATRPPRGRCPRARSAAMRFRARRHRRTARSASCSSTSPGWVSTAAPDWPRHPSPLGGYRVILEGMPTYTVDIEMHGRGQQHARAELRDLHASAQRHPRGGRRAAGHRVGTRPADGHRCHDRRRVDRDPRVSGVVDDLDGKVVVVTGASRGVGRGIARYLATCGARLVVSARGAEGLAEVSAELDELGGQHVARTADAADRDASFGLVAAAVDTFGTVDGIVANAADLERSRRHRAHLGVRSRRHLRGRRQGHALAHAGGVPGHAGPGSRPHRDVRVERRARRCRDLRCVLRRQGGDPGLTRTAATEWGRFGITVNCVCPVSVRHHTPGLDDPERLAKFERGFSRQPVPRDGRLEEDIAPVVGFLLSDASAFVTGQTLMADGGRIMMR